MILNSVLIQNDAILVICQYLQAKLQQFRDYKVLLHIVQVIEKNFGCCLNRKKKTRFLAFVILRCCKHSKKSVYSS